MISKRTLTAVVLIAGAALAQAAAPTGDTSRFFDAIQKQDASAVRALLARHPELAAAKDPDGRSAVMVALFTSTKQGFIVPEKNEALQAIRSGRSDLEYFDACGVGDAKRVATLLQKDPSLATSWSPMGWSALHLAAFSGDIETARLLIAGGADIEARARTRFKNTPLQVGLLVGHYDMTKLLIEKGADVLARQSKGFAPIHEAAFLGRRDLVDLLLESGAEVDARTNDGRTAVTEAMRRKHPEVAEYLRSKGGSGGEITVDLMARPD